MMPFVILIGLAVCVYIVYDAYKTDGTTFDLQREIDKDLKEIEQIKMQEEINLLKAEKRAEREAIKL